MAIFILQDCSKLSFSHATAAITKHHFCMRTTNAYKSSQASPILTQHSSSMKLLPLLVLVAIVEAKDFDHFDSPYDTDTDEQIGDVSRSPTEQGQGTLQDAPVREPTEPEGYGLDEGFFGEERTPMRAMRISGAFKFKHDLFDTSETTSEMSEEAGRPFVNNEGGPLRASRRSDPDVNDDVQELGEVKSEDIGLEGVYPYDDHFFGSEDDIVDGSGEGLDGFKDEDELFDFNNGEADEEDEDGMEFQSWSSAWKTAKSALKAGGRFLKTSLKTAGRGLKHGLKRAGGLVKNGVKRALPHLKEVGREFRDRAKAFIKEDGMDILFDGIRGAMGRGSGAPTEYDDTEDGAYNPHYGHAAETREDRDMPRRSNRISEGEYGSRDEEPHRAASGHRGEGSRRHSGGGKSGGHDDKDFEDDEASENDNYDAEESRGAEKRAYRGKQGRDGNRESKRGSGSRDEDEGASGDREEGNLFPV